MHFIAKLSEAIKKNNSLLSIGLDPMMSKIPDHLKVLEDPFFEFNKNIIEATYPFVCAYKPQIAHYSAEGLAGLISLNKTIDFLKKNHPEIPIILDAKRADIGSTAHEYAREVFDSIGADAVTVNPYFGFDSLQPFFERTENGIIILCRTSNKSASDFQDLIVDGKPLYLKVAEKIAAWNKMYHNCLMVVGATWPEELKKIRDVSPDMFFLVPGIGAQGGDLEKTLMYGLRADKSGLIIHTSRAIIYASSDADFAQAARDKAEKLRDQINTLR